MTKALDDPHIIGFIVGWTAFDGFENCRCTKCTKAAADEGERDGCIEVRENCEDELCWKVCEGCCGHCCGVEVGEGCE